MRMIDREVGEILQKKSLILVLRKSKWKKKHKKDSLVCNDFNLVLFSIAKNRMIGGEYRE